jgi:ppGpp synthetase/RelA/SpoT-type nucleotidyltranferase
MARPTPSGRGGRRNSGLDRLWRSRPEVIAEFVARRPDYEQLCAEVHYILERRLKARGVEVASIASRAKTLPSFLDKIGGKPPDNPLSKVTDLAGVRVVCLYRSDLPKIEEVIREEFQVKEKVDKLEEHGADRFGYGAIHFVVSLGKKSSGARYDDLRGLLCEIQTRTVAQDAWAIISHHLLYKQESAAPSALRRRLNSLAGVFETADDQFDALRLEREAYLREIEAKKASADILAQEVNVDTLNAYVRWRLPNLRALRVHGVAPLVEFLHEFGYATVGDIDRAVARAAPALEQDQRDCTSGLYEEALDYLLMGLSFADRELRKHVSWGGRVKDALQKYEHLVGKDA